MVTRSTMEKSLPKVLWFCAVIYLVVRVFTPGYIVGWDLNVYKAALFSLRNHHDPYGDAIAVQRIFHAQGPHPPHTPIPFCYVYSPITLPLVALAAKLPLLADGIVYWSIYIFATIFTLWFGLQFLKSEREKRVFAFVAPASILFPSLLWNDVILSGNVAYILYALVFLGAWIGWKRGTWLPFYVIIIAASCVKQPLLILVLIPVLSARKQWVPAVTTIAISAGLFLMQPYIWPTLYRNYMTGVELQFSFNHDFSASPSGITADVLYDVLPYKLVWGGFWVITSLLFGSILIWMRKQFLNGKLSLEQWVPLLLIGVALLSPRIQEYDIAPITLMVALVLWRVFSRAKTLGHALIGMGLMIAVANYFAPDNWRPMACLMLVGIYFAGAMDVWLQIRAGDRDPRAQLSPQ